MGAVSSGGGFCRICTWNPGSDQLSIHRLGFLDGRLDCSACALCLHGRAPVPGNRQRRIALVRARLPHVHIRVSRCGPTCADRDADTVLGCRPSPGRPPYGCLRLPSRRTGFRCWNVAGCVARGTGQAIRNGPVFEEAWEVGPSIRAGTADIRRIRFAGGRPSPSVSARSYRVELGPLLDARRT